MRPLQVGVIGIGFGQQVHMPAFRTDARCVISAISATTESRAKQIAEKLHIPKAYGNAKALIADPEIDIVSIAVPPAIQAELMIEAARAGKHLFSEKPLGINLSQAIEVEKAAHAAKVAVATDFLFGEIPAWQKARALLAAGEIGTPRHAAISWRVETYAHRMKLDSWKTRASDGGGAVNSFASHSLYYIEWLFGPIVRMAADLRGASAESGIEAWFDMQSGAKVTLSISADACCGSGHRIEMYGDNGAIILHNESSDYVNGFELRIGKRDSQAMTKIVEADRGSSDGRVTAASRIVHRLIDAIENKTPVSPGLAEAVRVQQLIDTMRNANHTRQWQSVLPPEGQHAG